jgi:hypothetical protein
MPIFVITTERFHESLLALFARFTPAVVGRPEDIAGYLATLGEAGAESQEMWMMFEIQPDDADPTILAEAVREGIAQKGVFHLDLEEHRTSITTAQRVAEEADLVLSVTVAFRPNPWP